MCDDALFSQVGETLQKSTPEVTAMLVQAIPNLAPYNEWLTRFVDVCRLKYNEDTEDEETDTGNAGE